MFKKNDKSVFSRTWVKFVGHNFLSKLDGAFMCYVCLGLHNLSCVLLPGKLLSSLTVLVAGL